MAAERVTDERIAETRRHAGVEQTEASFLLPSHFTVRPQQVLERQTSHNQRSCRYDSPFKRSDTAAYAFLGGIAFAAQAFPPIPSFRHISLSVRHV